MKQIALIACREPSYSRVAIVRQALQEHYQVVELLSSHSHYAVRLASVLCQLLRAWCSGRLGSCDGVVVGFFAQPIFPLVRCLYRGPILADAYFSIYDTMVHDKQKAKPQSLLGKLCFWLDAFMLKHADACWTDTLTHAEYFKSTFGVPQATVERLWISAVAQPLRCRPAAPAADDILHVFFWGGFIPLQGVETIVRAAEQLRDQRVHFTIFGTGQTHAACVALKEQLGLTNIDFSGWKSLADIQQQAERSHLALGIFGTTDKAGRVIPNKVFEGMAMGLPMITRTSPAAEELLTDQEHMLFVAPGSASELAAKIVWVRAHYAEACQIAARGQQLFFERVSPTQISSLVQRPIEQAIQRRRTSPVATPLSHSSPATSSPRQSET